MRRGGKTGGPGRAGRILVLCALCLAVAAAAAIPPGIVAARRAGLAEGRAFQARAEQLTRAIAAFSTTQVALREEGYASLRDVTAARHAMAEAVSVTITGPHQDEIYNSQRCSVRDYVLASDDAAWERAGRGKEPAAGSMSASDEVARKGVIADYQREVEQRLSRALGDLVQRYGDGQEDLGREIDAALSRELTAMGAVRSYPAFDPRRPAPAYVFYAPIAFFDPSVDYFCNGMVRLTVDTASLRSAAARARRDAWLTAAGFGLLAMAAGAAGAVPVGLAGRSGRGSPGKTRT